MLKISQYIGRCLRNSNNSARLRNFSSSAPIAETQIDESRTTKATSYKVNSFKTQNHMVAAAFASLQSENQTLVDIQTPFVDDKIVKARTVDELLSISEGSGVSRRYALNVVSVLAEWSSTGKAKLSDFENDSRFIKLCKILTKNPKTNKALASRSEDLSTILSVTADDEAAKLVASITLPQMVKVMSTLSQKKRRSTLLLRSLSYNITASSDCLNLKQSADLLYSMCTLNFIDDNLLAKIGADICSELERDVKKSSVIGSIFTSFGLLKYKSPETLDALSEWVLKNHSNCRPQDIFSLFLTLAVLNYTPTNSEILFKTLVPQLTQSEARRPLVWLNIVWSLVLLNQATASHVSSVLEDNFINKIEGSKILGTSTKLKLLNIDGATKFILKDYQGPSLSASSSIHNVNISRTKEKEEMVDTVIDTLRNLIQGESHLNCKINTGLGFIIDAVCVLDKKCNPHPIAAYDSENKELSKIAFISYDYHDMTRGRVEPTGINVFACKLLEAQNYKVLATPYTEFSVRDKLIHRVQYLETKLKEIVK